MYKIYISTFGRKTINVKGGVPIEVGADKRNNFLYELHDNIGDNISSENEYYGELSGLYWIWKNCDINDYDIIGFAHYNKCLDISEKKAEKWLDDNPSGIITLQSSWIRDHPRQNEVASWIQVISKFGNKYLNAFYELYDDEARSRGDSCRACNMFIAKGNVFKQYCEWLFSACREIRTSLGDNTSPEPNMKRYCAFFGERMLAVYIRANRMPVLEVNCRYQRWWLPWVRKIATLLKVNKENRLYIRLRNRFGYASQYFAKN